MRTLDNNSCYEPHYESEAKCKVFIMKISFHSNANKAYCELLTVSPAPSWLDSSVGRALHRHRRGHGFESRSSLNFFQAFFSQLLKLRTNCEDFSSI